MAQKDAGANVKVWQFVGQESQPQCAYYGNPLSVPYCYRLVEVGLTVTVRVNDKAFYHKANNIWQIFHICRTFIIP